MKSIFPTYAFSSANVLNQIWPIKPFVTTKVFYVFIIQYYEILTI